MPFNTSPIDLSVVVPVHQEEAVIKKFYVELKHVLRSMQLDYEVIFVDDGSKDGTFEEIKALSEKDAGVYGIKLSRNFGHQMSLLAGMRESCGRYVVMMDGDLQHPPELIPKLWEVIQNKQLDIAYTIRLERTVGWFKKVSRDFFYKLFALLSDVPLQANAADFRMISRKVCDYVIGMDERDLFMRGIFAWVGFSSIAIEYEAAKRVAGDTSYNIFRMFNLFVSGITSFSIAPLRLSLLLSAGALICAFGYSVYAVYVRIVLSTVVPGWTSLIIMTSFFFSCVFFMLGIIGEYIAKIHIEIKKRPHYLIDKKITNQRYQAPDKDVSKTRTSFN